MRCGSSNPVALFFLVLLLSLAAGRAEGVTTVQYGEMLYGANCRACHGENGSGGLAPRLAGRGNAATWDFQRFRETVIGDLVRRADPTMPHFGLAHIAPTGKAPTNEQLRAIQAYLASVKS
jgi:mono/diheme cytochrome c family protein